MAEFRKLDLWQKAEGKSDADTARDMKIGKSVFSRFRNGLQTLKMRDLLRFEAVTGITPAECAEFYAEAVKERARLSDAVEKKSLGHTVSEAA